MQIENMTFGVAIEALKQGKKVARAGWNGKGMFLYYIPANDYPVSTEIAVEYWKDKQHLLTNSPVDKNDFGIVKVPYSAYIAMKTAQEEVTPWLASQSDVLAEDWQIV